MSIWLTEPGDQSLDSSVPTLGPDLREAKRDGSRLIVLRSRPDEIEKAIQKSDLGLSPNNDGKLIRINIPPLTEERRKEFVKLIHKHAEEGRVAVRGIRQDANKHLDQFKKDKTLSEDEIKKNQDRIQKMTDQSIDEIKKLADHKEKEILEI